MCLENTPYTMWTPILSGRKIQAHVNRNEKAKSRMASSARLSCRKPSSTTPKALVPARATFSPWRATRNTRIRTGVGRKRLPTPTPGFRAPSKCSRKPSASPRFTPPRTVLVRPRRRPTSFNRAASVWVGTNDTPTSGTWSPSNPAGMVEVESNQYDNGGVGDGDLTETIQYPGNGAPQRVTQYWFNWRASASATSRCRHTPAAAGRFCSSAQWPVYTRMR